MALFKVPLWSLIALMYLVMSSTVPIYAQTFSPFASDEKSSRQSKALPIAFQVATLSGAVTDIPVTLSPQAIIKIENNSIGDIYSISIDTDSSGPLSLRLLQLELNDNNQVKRQTLLSRADINGGQATSLALPDTLLPTGSIYIGIGARGDIKGTLKVKVDSVEKAQAFKIKDIFSISDDRFSKAIEPNACFMIADDKAGHDLTFISKPSQAISLQVFGKKGKYSDDITEKYKGTSPLVVKGLSSKNTSKFCISETRNRPPVRIKVNPTNVVEEPNAQLDFADVPLLKIDTSLTFNTFITDADVLRLEPVPEGKAHMITVNGVLGATACIRDIKSRHRDSRECYSGIRRFGPMLGGDNYTVEFSNIYPLNDTYQVTSELVDFNEAVDRYEPNLPPKHGNNTFAHQGAPLPDSKSGRIRLKGSHINSGDSDGYHWADIKKEQLWRVRAIGPGLTSGEIRLNGELSVRLTRPPGTSGRLVADDVFLRPGKAMVTLKGDEGDYSILFRPLGSPPKGFELEEGADGKGQRLFFGKTVSGQLRRGDLDRYTVSLTKPIAVTLNLTPPLGASTRVYAKNITSQTITAGDPPIKLVIPAGNHVFELKPVISSPMDYSLRVDRRNPFTIEPTSVSIKHTVDQQVRAWSDDLQNVSVPFEIEYSGTDTLDVQLVFETPTHRILATQQVLNLGPEMTQPTMVDIRILPNLPPGDYSIMVGLKSKSGEMLGYTEIKLQSLSDVSSVNGETSPSIPPKIVGAIDMAHRLRGAKWINIDAGKRSFIKNLDYALDGLLITEENKQSTFRFDRKKINGLFDLKLGVTKPTPLVGVGFTLVGTYPTPLETVEIHTSVDGEIFEPWIKGNNDFFNETQYMMGPIRLATHVRLVLPASENAPTWTRTTEFHVFAEPGKSGLPEQDLLKHGYSAKSHLNNLSAQKQSIMKATHDRVTKVGKKEINKSRILQGSPISFRNTMKANIKSVELEWVSASKSNAKYPFPLSVRIMAANNLVGPWKEVGKTAIPDLKLQPIVNYKLPKVAATRFIRFDYEVVNSNFALLPAKTSVFEQAEGDGYISVLGEWDKYTKRFLTQTPLQNGGTLALNAPKIKGHVQFSHDEDNWVVEVPTNANTLIVSIQGEPGFHPQLSLLQAGESFKSSSVEYLPEEKVSRYRFNVKAGETVTLKVNEDKRSTYILFKQSGRMKTLRSRILNGIVQLSKDMVAGRDAVALSAMDAQSPPDWITDPDKVSREFVDYFKANQQSGTDAVALTMAAKSMKERTGSKAILLIGDGESGDSDPELEIALQASGARLFIAKPPGSVIDSSYVPENDVLQGWAQLGGGDVQYTTTFEDYEMLFSRVSAKLSGPKSYLISAKVETRSLKPGFVNVIAAPTIATTQRPKRTQIVLLDTSGSMLKRTGKTYRYKIARAALKDYVTSQAQAKPSDSFDAIGLRVFGGPPAKCETNVVLAPAPLNVKKFIHAVNNVVPRSNAKTPIAQALKSVANEIRSMEGSVSLLLLTDGEETCGGDPLAEIKALAKSNVQTRLDVVSFALAKNIDREPFQMWAKEGGGQYVDAQTSTDLRQAIKNARATSRYKVMNGDEEVFAGHVGTLSSALPARDYDLIFEGGTQRYPILIKAEETVDFKVE